MASLRATWDDDHLFIMKQSDDLYHYYKDLVEETEGKIEELVNAYSAKVDKAGAKELCRSHKQAQQHTEVAFDVEQYAYHLWGVNVMNIPCMSKNSVLRLVAELGADFTQKFPDVKHFLSWANLVPDNKISGGQTRSQAVSPRKRTQWDRCSDNAQIPCGGQRNHWATTLGMSKLEVDICKLWWLEVTNLPLSSIP